MATRQDKPTDPERKLESPDDGTEQIADLSDKSLLRRLRVGQEDAATALYLRYAKRLQKLADSQSSPDVAVRLDPEGIVQSVFRTFFRRAAKGQYEVLEGEDLWKLFLVISLNKIRSTATKHRTAKRDVARTQRLESHNEARATNQFDDEVALSILKLTIDELLADLPESQRAVITMRLESHSVEDIAQECGRAKRSVERILQQFRQRLNGIIDHKSSQFT